MFIKPPEFMIGTPVNLSLVRTIDHKTNYSHYKDPVTDEIRSRRIGDNINFIFSENHIVIWKAVVNKDSTKYNDKIEVYYDSLISTSQNIVE